MLKDTVSGIIRHLMTFGGGALATNGLATTDEVTSATGAVVTLVGVGWSVISKYLASKDAK